LYFTKQLRIPGVLLSSGPGPRPKLDLPLEMPLLLPSQGQSNPVLLCNVLHGLALPCPTLLCLSIQYLATFSEASNKQLADKSNTSAHATGLSAVAAIYAVESSVVAASTLDCLEGPSSSCGSSRFLLLADGSPNWTPRCCDASCSAVRVAPDSTVGAAAVTAGTLSWGCCGVPKGTRLGRATLFSCPRSL